jgi:hypothetical protein
VCRSKHVEQLRNIGIINSTTRLHLVVYFYKIYIMMHGSMNIKEKDKSILMKSLVFKMKSLFTNCNIYLTDERSGELTNFRNRVITENLTIAQLS